MKMHKFSSTQITIGVAALALTATIGLFLNATKEHVSLPTYVPAPSNNLPKMTDDTHANPTHSVITPNQAAPQGTSNTTQKNGKPTNSAPSAWKSGDLKASTPSIPLNEKISQYEIVEVEQHPASYPTPGQQMELPMLNGEKVLVDVQSSTKNPNGDYSWSGHLQDHGTDYPVVMTYGEHSVFATITTPKGSYTMESVNGSGWLYKNPSEFELSDPGANDYLEPHDLK